MAPGQSLPYCNPGHAPIFSSSPPNHLSPHESKHRKGTQQRRVGGEQRRGLMGQGQARTENLSGVGTRPGAGALQEIG